MIHPWRKIDVKQDKHGRDSSLDEISLTSIDPEVNDSLNCCASLNVADMFEENGKVKGITGCSPSPLTKFRRQRINF